MAAVLTRGVATTKGSDTTKLIRSTGLPSRCARAPTNSRNGGFCPDSSASELPAGPKARQPAHWLRCQRAVRAATAA